MDIDSSIFKAYDIRGIYPEQINEEVAYLIGQAYAWVIKPRGEVMVGRDVRVHSQALQQKVIEGLTDAGVNVVDVGLITTDMTYFITGKNNFSGGIQVTASHNPPEWHGAKMVKEGVVPMNLDTEVGQIRDLVVANKRLEAEIKGKVRQQDFMDDYCQYILGWIDTKAIKPMKVVYNPNFGLAGVVFERIIELGKLPITLVPLNEKPDGTFPKGRPDPFIPENRPEFVELVKSSGADLGITWDGDSDRVFFCADGGEFLEPYYLNTVLAKSMLSKHPGEKVVYDLRYTWALEDAIKTSGGVPIISRVGHSYIKQTMRKENVVFGAESSGHTYYRDYWYSDCGMIPPVQVLEFLSQSTVKLSQTMKAVMAKFVISGEINQKVSDVQEKYKLIKEKYTDGNIIDLDGVSVEYPDFRFNVRPSNTEPLLRLNLEAKNQEVMEKRRDEVLALIKD